jgi:hypothetical protein
MCYGADEGFYGEPSKRCMRYSSPSQCMHLC